jgi:predicted Zn-dependent protease with MMP-like domain
VVQLTREEFEELVGAALDGIPPKLAAFMNNVAIIVADEAPEAGLLGLYEGIPLTERDHAYSGVLPDRISIFRDEICAICDTREQVVEEVRITVVHEIAHHFGIDDERLRHLGW